MIGKRLLHYRILKTLGHGGMGEVYLAQDEKLDRRVALKTIPVELAADPIRRRRFERESKVLGALNHPNIVTVHAIEESEGHSFLVMELIEGATLASRIPHEGMEDPEALGIAIPMAEAVAAAHAAGVVHRDLKPDNVMIRADGLVKVVDFGLSRLEPATLAGGLERSATDQLTTEGNIVGTVHYMSPEQLEGQKVDTRSDVFSMGVVLYEMTMGSKPFKGLSPLSIATAILRDQPDDPPSGTRLGGSRLGPIIQKCLEKDSARRFQHAGELRDALVDLRDGIQHEAWRSGASGSAGPSLTEISRRKRLGLGLAASVLLLFGAWLGVRLLDSGEEHVAAAPPPGFETPAPDPDSRAEASPQASAAYQRGRYFLDQRTQGGFQKALEKFREALVFDPEYADAHAGLAHTYNLMASYKIVSPEEGFEKAREAAETALRLDPDSADAYAALAFIEHYWEWDLRDAEVGFRRALELDPDDPELHHWLALLLIHTARFDEAVDHALTAARLAPLSLIAHRNAATVLYFARRYEQAQEYLDKTKELDPEFSNVHVIQGSIHEETGRLEDAEAEYRAELELGRGWGGAIEAFLGHLYTEMDRPAEARTIAESLEKGETPGTSPFFLAAVWAGLEERDRAFEWLEEAREEKDRFLLQLRAEPRFDELRSDSRYLGFLEKVGLLVE